MTKNLRMYMGGRAVAGDRLAWAKLLSAAFRSLPFPLLLLFALLMGTASPALAANCSDPPYFGTIDGNFVSAPSQIQIDANCTIRNFPSPTILNTNFSFYTQPGGNEDRWLVVFDNVVHTGNMSCNSTHQHKIWFTNGSSTKIQEGCQNLLIPVEKIDKQNPAGLTTATIGVPFTYSLTIPVLYDPAIGVVINSSGSPNTLHGITLRDDLNATGADLTYVSHVATWKGSGTPVPHTFSNVDGVLTFEFPTDFVIPAGGQILLEITVVLDDTPANMVGTQFVNTAKWEFGRLIDGIFYEPLPGEWGRTLPMTIVGPDLVVTKTGPATLGSTLNLGDFGYYGIEVLNTGFGDAWNVTILDRLPGESSNPPLNGGMCDMAPEVSGVTLAGRPLIQGTDYTLSYAGAPACALSLALREAAGPIGPGERLMIEYRTRLDEGTEDGAVLTNVAGATQWSNDRNTTIGQTYSCPLTDGTVGTLDCQDAHAVLAAFSGYFFDKTAHDPVTGERVTAAMPGDTLRYRVRLRTIDEAFTGLAFYDDLGSLNASPAFEPGSLTLVSYPAGANISNTAPTGGANGDGILDIRGLDLLPGETIEILFDIALRSDLLEETVITNQADLNHNGITIAVSNDPNITGPLNAAEAKEGDAHPTRVTIQVPLPEPPLKETLRTTATIGEEVTYRIVVPGRAETRPLYDVVITDLLDPNLEYVGATVTGIGAAGVSNTSTESEMTISITEIPAGGEAVIELRTRVRNVLTAQQGVAIENTASYTYANRPGAATRPPLASETAALEIVEPYIEEIVKRASTPAPTAGEIVRYSVTLTAGGGSDPDVFDVTIIDSLGLGLSYAGNPAVTGTGNTIGAPVITGDGSSTPQMLVWGLEHGNADIDIAAGTSVTLSYDVRVLDSVLADQTLINSVIAQWTGLDGPSPFERTGADGLDGLNDYVTEAAEATVTTMAGGLRKATTQNSAFIGERFSYIITVPAEPISSALQGVQIVDDLAASAADLRFVASTLNGAELVNSGTDSHVVLGADGSINVPANGQVVVVMTVELLNTETNATPGLSFVNTAWYSYSNGEVRLGGPRETGGASGPMTIVHPNLTVSKTGPESMRIGTPDDFTLEALNNGDAAAWNVTLTDRLPNPTPGGMCGTPPVIQIVMIHKADGSSVNLGSDDYALVFGPGEPSCEFTVTLLTQAAVLEPGDRLSLSYRVALDEENIHGSTLVNVAGATEWFSAEASLPERRAYQRELSDGTPGVVDHQDRHEVLVEGAILAASKTVFNATTNASGAHASPGDRLRYTIEIVNTSDVPLSNFSLSDELDRLNAAAMFEAGSLAIVALPAGAEAVVDGSGGEKGSGLLEVGNLAIAAAGEPEDTLIIAFEATLVPVITSGTVVLNQGRLLMGAVPFGLTDDPLLGGAQDPTETVISSAPQFEVWKTSQIMGGEPPVLIPGGTLRYTITVKNVGNEDAVDVVLRDDIPAHTTYVPGSTTLNGVAVADPSPGVSPLAAGMLVNAPENPTPGFLRADSGPDADNVATVTFDVVVDPNAMDGLIIENQGFVRGDGAGSGPQPEQPSDGPTTPVPDDPIRDIVGNLPLLGAQKTVQIHEDFGTPGIVDPGDVLRYTIAIRNDGAIPATGVVLTDDVPVNTTYIADSLRLNGIPVGADGGVSPLIAGLAVHSSDEPGSGIVSAGASAVITFEVRVNDGVPPGTLIVNQGSVASGELPVEPTDADGLPSNGHQPTVIVVGEVQLLSMTKEVLALGGVAQPGGELEYVIRVNNIGSLPASHVVVTDDLSPPLGDQVTYVAGSGTLNGAAVGVSFSDSILRADYASAFGDLPPGRGAIVRFRVQIDPALPIGTTITNTGVVQWSDPPQSASAGVSLDLGGTPGSGALGGNVWHDANLDKLYDGTDTPLEGWSASLYRDNQLLATVLTDADGGYRFGGIVPNEGTSASPYEVRFRASGAGSETAALGYADSPFIDGPQRISGITVASGGNLQGLNLPLSPNGAVYNSVLRTAVAEARLALLNAATQAPLPSRCFDDPAQQGQVTARDGFYKFDLNFDDPACPPGGAYLIEITSPATGYAATPSQIIPPASSAATDPFSVPACLGSADDAVPSTPEYCQIVSSPFAAPTSVAPRTEGTLYHLHLTLSDALVPGESQIFNNHIPVDPVLDGAVAITKTSSLLNVTKGQLVPYTITVNNVFGVPLWDMSIVDRFPAGFKYVEGSARLDGQPREPRISGRELIWDGLELQVNDRHTLQLLLVVGAGVSEGEYVNRAQVIHAATGGEVSGEATATVRVVPDPTFDCTDIIGKVFDDRNLNGVQDGTETGLSGIRLVTARGLISTTDEHGRFHIACAVVPDQDRGSNFILKLDDRTLPTGYRVTTENPRVQRATRGKMMRFNFGATLHRVVGLDISDGVFEPDSTELRLQWTHRIDQLLDELKKGPAVLRLSYLADIEREGLVRERLKALKKEISEQWGVLNGGYQLTIETEVFWRRGGPPSR